MTRSSATVIPSATVGTGLQHLTAMPGLPDVQDVGPALAPAPRPIPLAASSAGKIVRWSRFIDPHSARALLVPIDHGLTLGPVQGLTRLGDLARWITHPAINGIIAHKGMITNLAGCGLLPGLGIMAHLNGMTSIGESPDTKYLLTAVDAAVRLGADAVSVQVNFGPGNHAHNLQLLGQVVDEAAAFQLPVLAMIYPAAGAGPGDPQETLRQHRHYLRVGYELGVDAIKTSPPRDLCDLPDLLEGIAEHLAVLISGGSLGSEKALTDLAQAVADSDATGLCVGRNVFQRPDPSPLLTRVRQILDRREGGS